MTTTTPEETKINRALELLGGSIDPEIAESYSSLEARILAQALENVELLLNRIIGPYVLLPHYFVKPHYRALRSVAALSC